MLQRIIDYEFTTIQHRPPVEYTINRSTPKTVRYNKFNIMSTLQQIPDQQSHILRWIGNDSNAHIMSLFYCLMMGCIGQGREDMFNKLKYSLYGLSEEFLGRDEQKVFVQNMCVLQYAKNIVEFLKKAKHFEDLLIKLFHNYRENVVSDENTTMQPVQQLKIYSNIFDFLKFNFYGNNLIRISMPRYQFYIIEENSCFFVSGKQLTHRVFRIDTEKIASLLIREKLKKKYSRKRKDKDRGSSFDTPMSPTSPVSFFTENEYSTPTFQVLSSNKKIIQNGQDQMQIHEEEGESDSSEKEDILVQKPPQNQAKEFTPIKKISLKRHKLYADRQQRKGLFYRMGNVERRDSNFLSNSSSLHFSPQHQKSEGQRYSRVHEFSQQRKKAIHESLGLEKRSRLNQVKKRRLKQKPQAPQFLLQKRKQNKSTSRQKPQPRNLVKMMQNSQIKTPKTTYTLPNHKVNFMYASSKER